MDKDKQARLEAKGWVFGDAEDFLRTEVVMSEKYLVRLDTLTNLFEKLNDDAVATLKELDIASRQIADLNKWRLALESLTPQGSEFHNDLDACLAYIHKRQMDEHERYKAKHRKCADLEVKLRSVTDKITEVSHSVDLEEIGTPVCNCGGRADNIADALYAIIKELKKENNDDK